MISKSLDFLRHPQNMTSLRSNSNFFDGFRKIHFSRIKGIFVGEGGIERKIRPKKGHKNRVKKYSKSPCSVIHFDFN